MRTRARPAAALGLLLCVSACGSTVAVRGSAPTGGVAEGLGGPAAPAAPGSTPPPGLPAASDATVPARPAGRPAPPGPAAAPGSLGGVPATAVATSGKDGPGVTPTAVAIGVAIADDTKAANAAIGAGAVTHGDETSEYRAVVQELNAQGGLAGRKVVLVEYHYDITSGATTSTLEQAACTYFTDDHPVALVVNVALTDTGLACLTSHGIGVLGNSLSYSTDQTFTQFPRYAEPLGMNLSRLVVNYADGLSATRWFPGPTGKIGLLSFDAPHFQRAASQLQEAVARYGHTIGDVAQIHYPQSEGELGQESSDISAAVLRFRADNVTHVLFLDPSGVSQLLFLNNAESQRYRPRYAFGQSGAAAFRASGAPAAQFVGSVSVGWFPRLDGVPAAEQHYPPAEAACLRLYARHGIAFDSDNARRHGDDICDTFSVLGTALPAVRGAWNADTLVAAVRSLQGLGAAATYRLALAGRADGVDQLRYSAYDASCDCWHYTSPVRPAR